jgi:hypothetical protein
MFKHNNSNMQVRFLLCIDICMQIMSVFSVFVNRSHNCNALSALAADVYAPNGVYADSTYKKLQKKGLKYRLSYQAAWDQHAHMLEKLAASVPMAVIPGSE